MRNPLYDCNSLQIDRATTPEHNVAQVLADMRDSVARSLVSIPACFSPILEKAPDNGISFTVYSE